MKRFLVVCCMVAGLISLPGLCIAQDQPEAAAPEAEVVAPDAAAPAVEAVEQLDQQNMVDDQGMAASEGEDITYSYGVVVAVSPTEIRVREYDYEKDEEIEVSYVVNEKTQFNNVNSGTELAIDDNVEIYYTETPDQKIASIVSKEEIVPLEEDFVMEGENGEASVPEEATSEAPVAPMEEAPVAPGTP